jgi:hypothetical protein
MAIELFSANPRKRERRNFFSSWLPLMLYSSRMNYVVRRVE